MMLSPAPEVVNMRASESLSSNPEESPQKDDDSHEMSNIISGVQAGNTDFSSKDYASELLERGLKEERFRIDRKKLEDMLQVEQNTNAAVENAEVFFQRVMTETSTLISWPSKLKIGAKSKKDPHVKVVGKPEAVQLAKEIILEILDTKKNRVTLKMDVSHTDHSYIIGKGGFKIQQVMEETGCHIHFPDSNRNSTAEKSNQVSIAGQAYGVELARSKIRELLPLVFMFELPNGRTVKPGDECSPAIQHIQQTYSFNVTFRSLGMGRTLLVVRGSQRLLSRLRQGLSLLMEYLIGPKSIPVMGFMTTEIAAQHHQFVIGSCSANTQMIMNKTGATIIFPDSSSIGLESPTQNGTIIAGHAILPSKSTVMIKGSFDSVCLAWQELIKCLPLTLMFDLKEGRELDPVMVNYFMESFNINIMVRPKIKENTKSVLIRGAEKDCKVLFQVRKEILDLDEDDSNGTNSPTKQSFRQTNADKLIPQLGVKDQLPRQGQGMSTAESLSMLSNIIQQNPQIVGLLSSLSSALPSQNISDVLPRQPVPNPLFRAALQNNMQQLPTQPYVTKRDLENWINYSDRGYALSEQIFPNYQKDGNCHADDDSGIFMRSRSCKYQSGLETRSDMSSQPESSASASETPDLKKNSFLRRISQSNEPNVNADVCNLLADYGNSKLNANKAMRQPIGESARTPTQTWSGYGFSKSMPDFGGRTNRSSMHSGSISEFLDMESSKINSANAESKPWTPDLLDKMDSPLEQAVSPFSFSNFWDTIPKQPTINYGSIKSLEQLLNHLDLEKYNEIFEHHEIDLVTFLTLNDADLQQLGVSYGSRRKMIAAISALREYRLGDCSLMSFRAAPGAERRSFFTKYSPCSPREENDGML